MGEGQAMDETARSRLLTARRHALQSQRELARELGFAKAVYAAIENGTRRPTLRQAAILEKRFGIPAASWVVIESEAAA